MRRVWSAGKGQEGHGEPSVPQRGVYGKNTRNTSVDIPIQIGLYPGSKRISKMLDDPHLLRSKEGHEAWRLTLEELGYQRSPEKIYIIPHIYTSYIAPNENCVRACFGKKTGAH